MLAAAQAEPNAPQVQSITVEGTELKVTMDDGSMLRSPELIGAKLVIQQGERLLRLRIDGIERDPDEKNRELSAHVPVWLHTISFEGEDGTWTPLCEPGPDGRRQAIPLAGRLRTEDNRFVAAEPGQFELACTGGAMGKCARFGYHPWQGPPSPTQTALEVYNACIRMVRADYGGLGEGTTRNGMRIELYDSIGVQPDDHDESHMPFEAGWTADGAVCVNHPRVADNITLETIETRWPRLAQRTGAICTEAFAREHGAFLFNRSAR
jgi:hypothetical protein